MTHCRHLQRGKQVDQLALVGYVWKPPGTGPRWEAGIPSLMRYVCR